jgi:glycosyltransferase involved in cell wall biosynthesis
MSKELQPRVSILTPVYNGAEHLAECIESVLRQTHTNWDYTIVNNCSKDESLAIAQKYAAKDRRIRVVDNERFLRIIENHNHTIRQLSSESKYCKFVFADDWLYPTCIEEMVRAAEENPSVGLVGAFTMDGRRVLTTSPAYRNAKWKGPLHPTYVVPGAEMCRTELLGNGGYVLGTMTSLLLRSDLIRKRSVFFNQPHLHADHEACFEVLKESDFGFCQQVLSYTRPRLDSTSGFADKFDVIILGKFALLLKYGEAFLDKEERKRRLTEIREEYYRILAHNMLRLRSDWYWKYHKDTLEAYGCRINSFLFARALLQDFVAHLFHPLNAFKRAGHWWSQAVKRAFDRPRIDIQRAP